MQKNYLIALVALILFGLTACGQTGPLYPASEHNTPQHRNDEFLLYSAPQPPQTGETTSTSSASATSSTTTASTSP